jgi:drug/metabolite transporter (DMT)-like permease
MSGDGSWIAAALVSALFVAARFLYIKRYCAAIPADLLVFSTRLTGAVLLAPLLLLSPPAISAAGPFWRTLALTVVITAAATVVQVRIIQRDAISRSMPYTTLTPLFMLPWTLLLFGEVPSGLALVGLLLACAGAYILNRGPDPEAAAAETAPSHPRFALGRSAGLMILVAAALGATTTLDKIAIGASSAFTYTCVWTASSAVFMVLAVSRHGWRVLRAAVLNRHAAVQSAFWCLAFFSQMAGVQMAASVPNGVTYVKMLTLMSVLLTVGVGGRVFREGRLLRSLVAALLMTAGAIVVVLTAGAR